MSRRYFDLHCHPVLKTLFKEQGNRVSPWKNIRLKDVAFGNALDSQSSLRMIVECGNMNLVCMPMYAPEMAMMNQALLKSFAPFYKEIDKSRIEKMGDGTYTYAQVRNEEWKNLHMPAPGNSPILKNKNVKVLTDIGEYNSDDMDTIHIILSVEGVHNFYPDNFDTSDTAAIVDAFETEVNKGYLFLYLTPAHLAPNIFVNHCYGIKFFSKYNLVPVGDGIMDRDEQNKPDPNRGYGLINRAQELKVLIDIKHMSLKARKEFYRHHAQNFPDRPIIASHMGVTGFSWDDIGSYVTKNERFYQKFLSYYKVTYKKKLGHIDETCFNPVSINMYDEDIAAVLKSKGIIGMSLDVRILGAGKKLTSSDVSDTEKEFVSIYEIGEFASNVDAEYKLDITGSGDDDVNLLTAQDLLDQEEEKEELLELPGPFADRHARFFLNNVFHICRVAKDNNIDIDPLKHICIGSDFDGLIQALDCCRNITEMPSFAQRLEGMFVQLATEAGVQLVTPVKDIIDDIFYYNAVGFIENHFSKVKNKLYN